MRNSLPESRIFLISGVLLVALIALSPWGLAHLRIDNGIEQWVEADSHARNFAAFQKDFGGDAYVLLAYEGKDLFEESALDLQLRVLDAIEAVPGVVAVKSLPSLFRDHFGAESPEELTEEVRSSPFYDHVIVSPDRRTAGMIISGQQSMSTAERRAYIAALRRAASPLADDGWDVHWAGPAVLNVALDAASESESRRLLPVAILASCLCLALMLRSVRKVGVVCSVSMLAVTCTLGVMGCLGLTMNMVTVALPPVLWVLSMAYTLHLLRYYDAALHDGRDTRAALKHAIGTCARPGMLAALTTALGFLSLFTAGMAPVRELGIAGGIGIPIAFVATMGAGPLLIVLFRVHREPTQAQAPRWVVPAALRFHERHAALVLVVSAVTAILLVALSLRVRSESNPLTFLDPDSEMVRDSEAIAQHFSGLYTLETVIQLPGSWLDESNWGTIEQQTAVLSAEAGIARVISPLDYLKKLQQWSEGGDATAYTLPADSQSARALAESMPTAARAPLEELVSADGTRVRLSSLVSVMDGATLLGMVARSEAALQRLPQGATGYNTGVVLRLVNAQFGLIKTQMKSLLMALVVVFACVWIGLGSTRLMLLSLAPNLLPVAGLFGVMGLAGIPLDPATVMVAAIAVGIAVDDTLHLLSSWREGMAHGADAVDALHAAIALNAPAVIATSLTASLGFISLAFSDFAPIRYFGLLSAGVMLMALAADLWLLPASIMLTQGRNIARP